MEWQPIDTADTSRMGSILLYEPTLGVVGQGYFDGSWRWIYQTPIAAMPDYWDRSLPQPTLWQELPAPPAP